MKFIVTLLFIILIAALLFQLRIIHWKDQLLVKQEKALERNRILCNVVNNWCMCITEGKDISIWLERHNYKKIAIYGMGICGEILYKQLSKNSQISVLYGIDRKKDIKIEGIDIWTLDDELQRVDIVIVTAIASFEGIKADIENKCRCKVICLDYLIDEMCIWSR